MKPFLPLIAIFFLMSLTTATFAEKGTAYISGTEEGSSLSGIVTLEETNEGLQINAQLKGLAKGEKGLHGFHIHQYGSCDNSGNAAGGHWNPTGSDHGYLPEAGVKGSHAGDLGNLSINTRGEGSLSILIPSLSLSNGEYNVAGRAFILHAKADDFGQPTGNAGARIGCGVITINAD